MRQRLTYERAEFACIRILSETGSFRNRLQRVADTCLVATGVSRVYVFENEDDPTAGVCMTQVCEACAEGVTPQIGNPELRHLPYAQGAPSLLPDLQARESYARVVSELEGPEREILEAQDILSILIVPVFAGADLWGFVGFDDCATIRKWQEEDIRILESIADALGMAVSRRQRGQMLQQRISFERTVAVACSRLAQADASAMDDALICSLEEIGRYASADRAYLFQFRDGNTRMDNTHEWCAEGIDPQIDNLQDIALDGELPWFAKQVQKGEAIYVPRVTELAAELELERRHFEQQGIQSLIIVPMKVANRIIGFLGFDAVKTATAWSEDDQMLLRFVAETVAGTLARTRQERALEESRKRYRHLLDLSPDGIVVLDPETARPLEFNETAYRQLEYSREEFSQLSLADIDVDETPEETRERIRRLVQGERSDFDTKHRTKTGKIRDVRVTAQYLKVAERPIYYCVWRDITPYKRAERTLLESEANFRHFFESMTDLMVVATPEGRVLFTNQAARDKLGYSQEEFKAMHILDWHRPEDRCDAKAIFAAMLRGERDHCPLPLMAKDGRTLPVETRVWFGKWSGQDCVFGISKDLSVQQEAQQRFERIFRSNPSPMALSSIPERRFIDINDAFIETTGYAREEIIGKTSAELGLFVDPENHDAIAETLRVSGNITNYELQLRRKDGTLREGLFSGEVIRSQGHECFLTVMIDITERKQAEKDLRYNHALVSSLLDSIPDIIFYKTPAGIYLGCNAEFARHAGRTREEIVGKTDYDLYEKHAADAFRANDRLMLEQGTPRHNEEWIDYPDGRRVLIDTLKAPLLTRDGEIVGLLGVSRDITQQREAEAQLRLQSLVLNQIQDSVTVTDIEGVITFVNDSAARSVGYSREELAGQSVELYGDDPERGATQRQIVKETLKHGEWRGEVVNRTAEGEDVILDCRTQVVLDEQGNKIALAGIATDITERKRMEEELRRSEAVHRALVEGLPDIVMRFDRQGRHLFVSDNVRQIVDIEPERFIGKTHAELGFPEEQCRFWEESIRQVFDSGAPLNTEFCFEGKSGSVIFDWRLVPERDTQGVVSSVLSISRDMTAHRKTEQEYKTLFREMLDGFAVHEIILDAAGTPVDYRFLAVNPAFERMTSLKAENIVGRTVLDVLPKTEKHWIEAYGRVALSGEPVFFENYSAEIEKHFEVTAFRPAPGQFACIFQDITQRKQLEQERLAMERQLLHAQKLESLGVLAGGIAHDFNNLLMSILGHADLALDALTPMSPARANIEQIEIASRRAADLCRQMLAYSGRGKFIVETFDIGVLIEEMAHLLKTSISKKAILNLQIEKDLPEIEGDATQIRQVVMNMVINASEAIGERSGVISIHTGASHCQAADFQDAYVEGAPQDGLYVYLEVTDTGCGMDRAILDRLFEPFFTTKFTGRGLGMSAVLGIVRGHNGILKVKSEIGRGTTFRVLFPPAVEAEEQSRNRSQAENFPQKPNGCILLVDDEESVRALGRMMLERIGFQVITASDGRDALKVFERERDRIDLVVLDLTMPHMNGEETYRELRRFDPQTRIVMSSGYSNHEIESRFAGQGLLGIIQKPYTMAQLKEVLYPLFDGSA